jgi:hypothetical protein
MHKYLLSRGWKRRQLRPKEPWIYLDPLGCVEEGMRARVAFELQKKREKTGVAQSNRRGPSVYEDSPISARRATLRESGWVPVKNG